MLIFTYLREFLVRIDPAKKITPNMYVCSAHFSRDDYMPRLNENHPLLRKNEDIVPTLMLPKRPLDRTLTPAQEQGRIDRLNRLKKRQLSKEIRLCCVPECHASSLDRSFHLFPKDEELRKKWIKNCNITKDINRSTFVCSLHFKREDYTTDLNAKRPQLKKNAIPTENIQCIKEQFILPDNEVQTSIPIAQSLKKDLISKWEEETSQKNVNATNSKVTVGKRKSDTPSSTLKIGPKSKILKTEAVNIIKGLHNKEPLKLGIGTNVRVQQITPKEILTDTLSKTQFKEDLKERQRKVTTIIYLPSNCKKLVDEKSGNIKIDLTNNSTVKKVIVGSEKNIDPKVSNINIKKNIDIKSQKNIIHKDVSNITLQENSKTQKQKTVNISAEQFANKQVDVVKKESNKRVNVKNVSAIILCTGCGQYCKIIDEELISADKKNIETLAAETLLELQKVDLTNENEHILLTKKGIEICDKALQRQNINLMDIISSDDELQAFTGITFDLLDTLTKLVVTLKEDKNKQSTSIREKIVMCLCKLKTNLPFRCIAILFGVSQQVCTSDIFTMIRNLSKILEKTIYWLKTDELLKTLPERFHSFKQTRAMLVCNTSQTEKLRCLKCQSVSNLNQHDNESIKYILGVAPTGLIVFKSNLFNGKLSNDVIISKTKVMDQMDSDREAIIAHESLDLEAECLQRKITLIKIPKLKNIFDSRDVEIIKSISSARIHVDRTLQRFKTFKILQSTISWKILPFVDNISTIIAGIVNLRNPTPPDKKRLEI